jgi:hypothetical protein
MNPSFTVKLVPQNLADDALALAPGEGWRREVEVDATALRRWLGNFAALPPLETEEADAGMILTNRADRMVVKRVGGHLGTEMNRTFVAATVDEIMSLAFTERPHGTEAAESAAVDSAISPAAQAKGRAQSWLLAGLLAVLAGLVWWSLIPETPEGVEWLDRTTEGQAILARAAGRYASVNERLVLDSAANLSASDEAGEQTLQTTVRVGRRAGTPVVVTEAGVLFELASDGTLHLGEIVYHRGAEGPTAPGR